ncbi:MAG TPA: hypothetical protein QF703_04170 [Candidatus Thalassarchaeaceae archaeon]|nr:hypothetical protein [Candidatus Thalassarchaeaceae archaeon]
MRGEIAKSLKLNRDLEKYVERGISKGLPVKIGWGQAGDERPKNGEIGVITHLPEKSKVICLGDLGECSGSMNKGGTFTLKGSAASMFGAFHVDGKTTVEKDCDERVGYRMRGGEITVHGSVGDEAGSGMSGGTIVVRGQAGSRIGMGMSGGTILVVGSVGSEPCAGMTGGKVIVCGSCPPPGDEVEIRSIEAEEIVELLQFVEPLGISINEDALVIETSSRVSIPSESPPKSISTYFENVALYPSGKCIPEHRPLSYQTVLEHGNEERLVLPIPWLVKTDEPKKWKGDLSNNQPALVKTKPRGNDFLLIGIENIAECVDFLGSCGGIVLDMMEFKGLNDAEIEGLLVSLTSRMVDSAIVFIRGGFEGVDDLFRIVMDLDIDGAIIDGSSPNGSKLVSILPTVGIASKSMGLRDAGKYMMIEFDSQPRAKDLLIVLASGSNSVVAPFNGDNVEEPLKEISAELSGWMREIGIENIERIGRRNLRAMDYETAAISGLRLVGYGRPLPIWLDSR